MRTIKNQKPNKERIIDKEKLAQQKEYPTRPPRLEGVVKEAMMQPVRKKKRVEVLPTDGKFSGRKQRH